MTDTTHTVENDEDGKTPIDFLTTLDGKRIHVEGWIKFRLDKKEDYEGRSIAPLISESWSLMGREVAE